jgi:hypothetical protein
MLRKVSSIVTLAVLASAGLFAAGCASGSGTEKPYALTGDQVVRSDAAAPVQGKGPIAENAWQNYLNKR